MIKLKSILKEEKEAFQMEREGRISFNVIPQPFGYSIYLNVKDLSGNEHPKGYMNLAREMPDEMLGTVPWKYGYLLVDHIKVDIEKQGYGFLMYKEALKVAQKAKYKGLVSYRKGRSSKASDIWDKLATFSDSNYDYLDIKDLGTRIKESLNEKIIPIYRGESVYNKGGNFWTTDKNFAREFTQSGVDREILKRKIDTNLIYKANPLPKASSQKDHDAVEKYAIEHGFKAYWMDEGPYPPSIYVLDRNILI